VWTLAGFGRPGVAFRTIAVSSSIEPGQPAGAPIRALRRLFWRVHFWAGLLTAPLVLWAAGTGLLYVFTPQIEARVHADLDRVAGTGPAQPLDRQFAAALAAQPGWTPRSILPASEAGRTTQVLFAPPPNAHAGHGLKASGERHDHGLPQGRIVYIDPATAQVLGSLDEMGRFKTWAKKLHASALQGDAWRWPIELAASWMLLMFATGVAMWWPTRGRASPTAQARPRWRRLHTVVGLAASGFLAVVLLTGLTWSRHAGDHFRSAQQALGQASPKPPRDLRAQAGGEPLSMQALYDRARAEWPGQPLQLTPPRDAASAVWRIDAVVTGDPTARQTLMLDGVTGQVLWRSGWSELPALAKATAVGIPFHRAELGVWNQVLLALAALAAIASVVSGLAMAWLRRPRGALGGLRAPTVSSAQLRAVPAWLWVLSMALAFALPVFGLSLAVFAVLELLAFASRRARPLLAA
jgi:uncharacterized iron-regulated membrane protein